MLILEESCVGFGVDWLVTSYVVSAGDFISLSLCVLIHRLGVPTPSECCESSVLDKREMFKDVSFLI